MECETCRSSLGDLIDHLLTPSREAEVRRHLAGCALCGAEHRQLAGAAAALREAPPLEPPPGLLGSVLASLPPPPRDARTRGPAPILAPPSPRFLWIGAAAAVLLIAGLAGLAGSLASREGGRESRIARLEDEISGLTEERAALKEEVERSRLSFREERERLRGDLEKAWVLLEESRAAAVEDSRRRDEAASALKAELARLVEEKTRIESREIPALRSRLERSEGEARRAREELARVGKELELLAAARPPEAKDLAAPWAGPAREAPAERRETVIAGRSPRPSPVVLRRRGEDLELEVKGPRSVVIPALLRLAESDGGASSRLALNAMEDLLGADAGAPAPGVRPERSPGIAGWFSRSVDRIAGEVGLPVEAPGSPESTPEGPSPRERLRKLEERWRLLSGAAGEN